MSKRISDMKKLVLLAALFACMGLSASAQAPDGMRPDSLLFGQRGDSLRGPMPPGGGPGGPMGMMPDSLRGAGGGMEGPGGGMPPGGMGGGQGGPGGPGGMMPGGPGGRESAESTLSPTGYGLTEGTAKAENGNFSSTETDENAVKVTGGQLSLKDCTITKPGADSNNGDGTSFYGTNAAVLVRDSGFVSISGGTITTEAVGSNALVAYGGKAEMKDVTIQCLSNLSRGIHATGGGTITAENLTIDTRGNNSSVIATDRGGGVVNVHGGTYTCAGRDCAVLYSTGTISVDGIEGRSAVGEIGVIEGDNEINILNSRLESGDNRRGLMILQSGSGDAVGFNGRINVTNSTLKLTSDEAPLFEITTRTKGTVTLTDVEIEAPSGVLMQVGYNSRWQTRNPVAVLNLRTGSQAEYKGDMVVKDDGTLTVSVGKGVAWLGACDKENQGGRATVIVDGTWTLTADSYVDSLTINEGGQVDKAGYTLTIRSEEK